MRPITALLATSILCGMGGLPVHRGEPLPAKKDPTRPEDQARMKASADKKKRKLEKLTSTPHALAAKAETLANLELGLVWSYRRRAYVPGMAPTTPEPVHMEVCDAL